MPWGEPEEVVAVDVWTCVVLAMVAAVLAAGAWWKRRARRVYVINRVRVEMHPACVVEDRVIEQVWHAAISMTNTSRRPRTLPMFAERATVRAGRREYLATVYLDADVIEVSPADVAVAGVECVLPSGSVPIAFRTDVMHGRGERRGARVAFSSGRDRLRSPNLDRQARAVKRPPVKRG